jgi:hypothetical protein
MPKSTNKAIIAIGLLDLARHAARAMSASAEARRNESRRVVGVDWRRLAPSRMPDVRAARTAVVKRVPDQVAGRDLPWRRSRTRRAIDHVPMLGAVVSMLVVTIAAVAYAMQRHASTTPLPHEQVDASGTLVAPPPPRVLEDADDDEHAARVERATHRVANAAGAAIESGIAKVADGGTKAAAGAAAATGAGAQAAKDQVVATARDQLDERVVQPVKRKAITYGTLGFIALTVWVALVAVLVQLGIQALS